MTEGVDEGDWRYPYIKYLSNPSQERLKLVRQRAVNFVLIEGVLYRRGADGILLRCLSRLEADRVMAEVHEGICGAHQAGPKMRWVIRRHGHFWPTITDDCIKYARGCRACQQHGSIQRAPASEIHPIVKPWPFRGWAMDIIGYTLSRLRSMPLY